jgi:hypothetical protein
MKIMKVNVVGRGMIPGVGILPIRNIELSDQEIKRILNLRTARVYNAENGHICNMCKEASYKETRTGY